MVDKRNASESVAEKIIAKSIEFTVSRPVKNSEKIGQLMLSDRSVLVLPGSPEPDYCLRVIL